MFYFKSRDHWSEPAGVIVVENCTIQAAPDQLISPRDATYGIILTFGTEGNSLLYTKYKCTALILINSIN